MREHRYGAIGIATVLASLVAACGGGTADTQPRQQNPNLPRQNNVVAPETEVGPAPRDMPGGGRGSDAPHTKGKP
jgi:hypothetical protein